MFKMFAIICILVQDPLGIERQDCNVFYETNNTVYETETQCLEKAEAKAYEMVNGFATLNLPFDSMQFGCTDKETI